MRIGVIVDKCAPFYVGGYEDRYWNIARRLATRNEVRVYTTLPGALENRGGVSFYPLLTPSVQSLHPFDRSMIHSVLFSASLLRTPFGNWEPDVVIVEAIPYIHLISAKRWLAAGRWKTVLNVNEAWWDYSYCHKDKPPPLLLVPRDP